MILKSLPLLAAGILFTAPHEELRDMSIGDPLPAADVRMTDVSAKEMTLQQLAKENGLLVIFSCNTCPFVVGTDDSEGWEGRYPELGSHCRKNG
ncbi:MAG: thioredoxin family protein, partial [Flavobacteriales bacterium]|nr:thioredoxin family protein [Flavobacteriales bacterium]